MRAVHVLAVSAVLALGMTVAPTDMAQAQDLLQMSPPEDSSAQIGKPEYDDIKLQIGTALPPKTGSLLILNGTKATEWLATTRSARSSAGRRSAK